jgi:hypothetical protein
MAARREGPHRPERLNPLILMIFASRIHDRTLALGQLAWSELC